VAAAPVLRGLRRRGTLPLATLRSVPYNERIFYAEVVLQSVVTSGATSFLSVFLVRLGAPNWLVGLYASLPALATILSALPVGAYVQRQKDLIKTANVGRLIFRAAIGLFALVPYLPAPLSGYVLVGARSLIAAPAVASGVAHTTILAKVVPPRRRPQVLSIRMAFHGLSGAIVGYVAGRWLDATPFPFNYQVLFVAAFVTGLGSIYVYSRLRLPEDEDKQPVQARPRGARAMFRLIADAPAFRNFAIAAFLFRLSTHLPTALYTIYRVRTLGSSDAWIGVLLTVERLLSVVGYFALSRLLTKAGLRRRLWLSCVCMALYPITMGLARTPEMLLIPSVIVGLFGAGMNIFLTDTLIRVSPDEERPTFVAANTLLTNVTAFAAPMLGTALADVWGITTVLFAAGGLRLLGGLSFLWLGVAGRSPRPSSSSGKKRAKAPAA